MTHRGLRACAVSSDYPKIQCSHPGDSLPASIINCPEVFQEE
jgi:hypothetical protein